jgi:hypothetical protein
MSTGSYMVEGVLSRWPRIALASYRAGLVSRWPRWSFEVQKCMYAGVHARDHPSFLHPLSHIDLVTAPSYPHAHTYENDEPPCVSIP